MADTVWQTGKLRQVWNPVGTFEDGTRRLRLAGWEILSWSSTLGGRVEQYAVPTGILSIANTDIAASDRDIDLGREFGHYTIEADDVVVDFHQGDGSDNILGLHSFGVL